MKNLSIINVCENDYELYDYCVKNHFFEGSYDEFQESGANLGFFEGDPDMLKWNGETIYFALAGNNVFYYSEAFGNEKAQIEGILRDFFASGEMYNGAACSKFIHNKKAPANCQSWDAWESMKAGIAYRGGCGYSYSIIPLRAVA